MATFLIGRVATEKGTGAVIMPIRSGADAIAVGARLTRLAPPGFHDRTEWCCVEAAGPAQARWPDPEPPWAAPDPEKEHDYERDHPMPDLRHGLRERGRHGHPPGGLPSRSRRGPRCLSGCS